MINEVIHLLAGDVTVSGLIASDNSWDSQEMLEIPPRSNNQIFCNIEGTRDYYEDNQLKYQITPGDVLFMPTGSSYTTHATSPGRTRGLAVLFSLKEADGQEIFLGNHIRQVARDENGVYARLIRQLRQYMLQGGYSILQAKALLYDLLYKIATDQAVFQDRPGLKSIAPAIRQMENSLQCSLSMDDLAELCFMSKSTLHRRFQEEFHTTPTAYHLKMRIEKSRELLHSGLYSVEQVAELMGFCDTGYFSRMFKKYTGEYAGECRRSQKKNTVG